MSDVFTGILKDESAEAYHAKKDFVSSSPLPAMAKSPLHFFHKWKTETESTDPMERGNFMHKLLLEQDISKYVARPLNDKLELVRSNSKEYAAFLAQNQGKTPVHPDFYHDALAILTAACRNKRFIKAFEASDQEVSIYAKHGPTGLFMKARMDMIAKDCSFIADVKSTSNITAFERQIFNLGYDVRLVHYREVLRALTGILVPNLYFFPIESSAPYGMQAFRLSDSATEAAFTKWTAWMNEISACIADSVWPGFSDDIIDVDRPKYLEFDAAPSFDEASV